MTRIQLTEVDFDQIKSNLIDYLKSTGEFTDYDFDASKLQTILNLLAWNSQMNSYNANMIANESFLSSSTLRNNVVAHARTIGYTPTSTRSAFSTVTLEYSLNLNDYPSGLPAYLQLRPGPVFSTKSGDDAIIFNLNDVQTTAVTSSGTCRFNNIKLHEGIYLTHKFTVDLSDNHQRFILENINIDSTTVRVEVQEDPSEDDTETYIEATNLTKLDETSRVYWMNEVDDGKYELTFGDGFFGKALKDGSIINLSYIVSGGYIGNGVRGSDKYTFIGSAMDSSGSLITSIPNVLSMTTSEGGSDIEDVSSIKFRAPRSYAAQNRCVVSEDYEILVRNIFPAADDIYVYGGEELPQPEYGRVYIVIKPVSGYSLSTVTKNYIKESLADFRIASIDIQIVDPEIIYVEAVSVVYFDDRKTISDSSAIVANVSDTLSEYSKSSSVSKFGGAVRYSRVIGAIDDSNKAITRNNTEFRMRRDMVAVVDTNASYEVCFENEFRNNKGTSSVYSTGFQLQIDGVVDSKVYYFEDDGEGKIYRFYLDDSGSKVVVDTNFGTVDYKKGEILLGYQSPINIVNTSVSGSVVQIRAIPKNQDVIAKRSVYAEFDVANSNIVALVDKEVIGS